MKQQSWKTKLDITLRSILLWGAVIFVVLGLIDPQWWLGTQRVDQEWLDVMVMLDVSQSMQVMDMWDGKLSPSPSLGEGDRSRLDAAKGMVERMMSDAPQHRYGLGVFAGEAMGIAPLTDDVELYRTFLWWVDSQNVSEQGTDLLEALEFWVARFGIQESDEGSDEVRWVLAVDSSPPAPLSEGGDAWRVLLIISDGGEDEISVSQELQEQIQESGIYVMTIWVGTETGWPIVQGRDMFGTIIYKQYNGETVMSSANSTGLSSLAQEVDGDFVQLENMRDVDSMIRKMDTLESRTISKDIETKQWSGRFLVGIWGLLFLCYLISTLFGPIYITSLVWKN